MRTNTHVRTGQVWRSSDPRRLSSFRVINVTTNAVSVKPIYPKGQPIRVLRLDAFLLTGTKGYTRLT